ncbi:hypothetical protein H4R20_000819 [Coemansia guatemalensis]|uniref:Uncharacterized protein n=1 Tax=Coemansia guatemalensis TaxID=2761395 RepID=A0A9W8LWK6_9FUNG|nr:hypothetical protein H4R20_000819 [Coemansia guatemalensis]
MTTWNSEHAFAASTACMQNPSCSTHFNGPGFVQDEMPEVFASSSSAPLPCRTTTYMITMPMMIQTWAYIRVAPVMPGVCQQCLPEKLPQLELGGDSYDYLMDFAMMIQAHGLDLDEWGAQGIMASVDVFFTERSPGRDSAGDAHTDVRKDSSEARCYFLGSLDRVVQLLLLAQFPLWVQEGDLDVGYAFVNKADETFQLLTRQDPCYEDFHQFLDKSVQCALHPKIKRYAPRGNQTNDKSSRGFAQKKPNAPEHHGNPAPGRTSGTSLSENCNKPPANRHAPPGNSRPFRADVRRTEVEEPAPDTDATVADSNGADGPADTEDTTDMWQDTSSWSDTYSWDEQSDGDDDYDVRTTEVICGKVDDPVTTTAADLPPADDSLVGPWRILVTAETNGESLTM